jgi:hypothetical protein
LHFRQPEPGVAGADAADVGVQQVEQEAAGSDPMNIGVITI